jgi:hypothetical protein
MSKSPPQFDNVLGYLAYMPFVATQGEVLAMLKKYGRQLCAARSTVLTAVLIKMCIGDYAALLPSSLKNGGGKAGGVNTKDTAGSANNNNNGDLSTPSTKGGKDGAKTSASASVAGQQESAGGVNLSDIMKAFASLLIADSFIVPTERLPVVEVMSLYCCSGDDGAGLLTLLEGYVEGSFNRLLPAKVCSSLMEMYLQKYRAASDQLQALSSDGHTALRTAAREELEAIVKTNETAVVGLLDGAHTQYDPAHALLLCQSYDFERGLRYLLEKQQSSELLMRKLIRSNDVKEVFKLLRREGPTEPELFVQVLTYFVLQSVDANSDVSGTSSSTKGRNNGSRFNGGNSDYSDEEENERGGASQYDDEEDEDRYVRIDLIWFDFKLFSLVAPKQRSKRVSREFFFILPFSFFRLSLPCSWNFILDVMDLIEKESVLSPLQVHLVFIHIFCLTKIEFFYVLSFPIRSLPYFR